jgi:hypothetical protein
MSALPVALLHPLGAGVELLERALDTMPISGWDGLDDQTVKDLATRLMRVGARVGAHQSAATRALDESGLARRSGASSTGALLAREFGGDRAAGDRMVRAGKALQKAPHVEDALASGRVSERQARTIADATAHIDPRHRDLCQRQLVDDAQDLTAKDLERRALRATDSYKPKPEVDADENETLEQRERRAWEKAAFRMWDNHDGTHSGDFTVPEAQADALRAAHESATAPRRDHLHADPVPQGAATPNRLGRAFAEMIGRLSTDTLGDGAPTLVVRLDLDTLLADSKAATLSSGTRISACEARLMACRAGIIPAVFGGRSLPLDLGRAKRLFTSAQRLALAERDRGCAFPGCDRPPPWCEAHHWRAPWSDGGTTNLDDGVLLCAHHHRTIHHQRWHVRRSDDGIIEFRAPATTTWRRNQRYRA